MKRPAGWQLRCHDPPLVVALLQEYLEPVEVYKKRPARRPLLRERNVAEGMMVDGRLALLTGRRLAQHHRESEA